MSYEVEEAEEFAWRELWMAIGDVLADQPSWAGIPAIVVDAFGQNPMECMLVVLDGTLVIQMIAPEAPESTDDGPDDGTSLVSDETNAPEKSAAIDTEVKAA